MRKVFVLLVGLIGVLLFSSVSIIAADTISPTVDVGNQDKRQGAFEGGSKAKLFEDNGIHNPGGK